MVTAVFIVDTKFLFLQKQRNRSFFSCHLDFFFNLKKKKHGKHSFESWTVNTVFILEGQLFLLHLLFELQPFFYFLFLFLIRIMKLNSLEASLENFLKNFRGWAITKTWGEKSKKGIKQLVSYLLTHQYSCGPPSDTGGPVQGPFLSHSPTCQQHPSYHSALRWLRAGLSKCKTFVILFAIQKES